MGWTPDDIDYYDDDCCDCGDPYPLKCDGCGLISHNVDCCFDPYHQDVNDEEIVVHLCKDCYQESVWDI